MLGYFTPTPSLSTPSIDDNSRVKVPNGGLRASTVAKSKTLYVNIEHMFGFVVRNILYCVHGKYYSVYRNAVFATINIEESYFKSIEKHLFNGRLAPCPQSLQLGYALLSESISNEEDFEIFLHHWRRIGDYQSQPLES